MKKYLTTADEILSYAKSDTIIYKDDGHADPSINSYIRFVEGMPCLYSCDGRLIAFNTMFCFDLHDYYVLEKDPVNYVDDAELGKLCIFANHENFLTLNEGVIGILYELNNEGYIREADTNIYACCRLLTAEEVSKITKHIVTEVK